MTASQLRTHMILHAIVVLLLAALSGFLVYQQRMFDAALASGVSALIFGIWWLIDYSDRWVRVLRGRYP